MYLFCFTLAKDIHKKGHRAGWYRNLRLSGRMQLGILSQAAQKSALAATIAMLNVGAGSKDIPISKDLICTSGRRALTNQRCGKSHV